MTIKSLSRKTVSFHQVLEYINSPKEKGPALLHNLESDPANTAGVHREFIANARYLPKRKNGNVLYHEIMSFAAEDRAHVTLRIIEDLVRRYLEHRARGALAYACAHFDKDHVHVHILISANNLAATRRMRLSKGQFKRVIHNLELYQVQQYPQLRESVAIDEKLKNEKGKGRSEGKKKEVKKTWVERERDARLKREGSGVLSRKEVIAGCVLGHIQSARTAADFIDRLNRDGLEVYVNGKRTGVRNISNGVKHRFETLNVHKSLQKALCQWRVIRVRLQALDQVENEKRRREVIELGFRDDLSGILAQGVRGLSIQEQERLETIERVLREKRKRGRKTEKQRNL